MGDRACRGHRLAVGIEIVGDVQHRAQEGAIGLLAGLAVAGASALDDEAAFRADWHDHRVLDLLCLDEAQHLGAEIVAPVGPAKAAACDGAKAQVDALDVGRGDEDLAIGLRLRQIVDLAAGDLERDRPLGLTGLAELEEVGPRDGEDELIEAPEHPIVVEAGDELELLLDQAGDVVGAVAALVEALARLGIELHLEQLDQEARDMGMFGERAHLGALRSVEPGLLAIAGERTDRGGIAPGGADFEHDAVEAVILGIAVPDRDERRLELARDVVEHEVRAARIVDQEFMDPDLVARGGTDRKAFLDQRPQAHRLQDGEHVGERHGLSAVVELEAEARGGVVRQPIGAHPDRTVGFHRFDRDDVAQRLGRAEHFLIAGAERLAPATEEARRVADQTVTLSDDFLEPLGPGPALRGDAAVGIKMLDEGGLLRAERAAQAIGKSGAQVARGGERMGIGKDRLIGHDCPQEVNWRAGRRERAAADKGRVPRR